MAANWRTRLIHSGTKVPDGFRSLAVPVYRGSTTLFPRASALTDTWDQDEAAYSYGLFGTPTTLALAARIAELENGHRTFITPGGQAALVLVYFASLESGDHVLIPENVYGPSRAFANGVLRRLGVDVEFYPPLDGGGVASRMRDRTRLVWCENPGSITMDVQDVPAIAEAAHRHGALVALDNTWAAGVFFDAFGHGADIAVQALTKYVGGHSDLLLGSVTVRDAATYKRVGRMYGHLGLGVSPEDCSLALRGLQTLHVRLKEIERSALAVASWLAARPEIEAVLHPALPSCPGHETWKRDFTGSSGLFSIVFRPPVGGGELHEFVDSLKLFGIGYSWGGVTSLAVTYDDPPPSARRYQGRLVRLHVGLEDPADLVADLEQALTRMGPGTVSSRNGA